LGYISTNSVALVDRQFCGIFGICPSPQRLASFVMKILSYGTISEKTKSSAPAGNVSKYSRKYFCNSGNSGTIRRSLDYVVELDKDLEQNSLNFIDRTETYMETYTACKEPVQHIV
jgi:hypothetical protein